MMVAIRVVNRSKGFQGIQLVCPPKPPPDVAANLRVPLFLSVLFCLSKRIQIGSSSARNWLVSPATLVSRLV